VREEGGSESGVVLCRERKHREEEGEMKKEGGRIRRNGAGQGGTIVPRGMGPLSQISGQRFSPCPLWHAVCQAERGGMRMSHGKGT